MRLPGRPERQTEIKKKTEYYSDVPLNLDKVPGTSALGRVVNENAVKQAIKNIVLTRRGERPFRPNFGSDVHKSLFEPFGQFAAEDIIRSVKEAIETHEKRVSGVEVFLNPSTDQNFYVVTVQFFILNNSEPFSVNIALRRVR